MNWENLGAVSIIFVGLLSGILYFVRQLRRVVELEQENERLKIEKKAKDVAEKNNSMSLGDLVRHANERDRRGSDPK